MCRMVHVYSHFLNFVTEVSLIDLMHFCVCASHSKEHVLINISMRLVGWGNKDVISNQLTCPKIRTRVRGDSNNPDTTQKVTNKRPKQLCNMMDFDAFDNFDFTDANESIPSLNGSVGPEPCEVGSASDGSVSFVFNGKSSASDSDFPNDNDVSSLSDLVDTDEKRISSADSSDLSDWSDDEDEVDVEFLIAKRRILKRVAHVFESEDCYVASIAKKHIVDTPAAIWTDAKEIMSALTEKTGHRQVRFAPTAKTVKRQDPIVKHIRKKPRIDVSNVNLVDARDFVSPIQKFQPCVGERPESLCGDSTWMIKALQQHYDMPTSQLPTNASSESASSSSNEARVESQKGISSKMDFTSQGTTLEDALAITTKPK